MRQKDIAYISTENVFLSIFSVLGTACFGSTIPTASKATKDNLWT